MFSRSHGKILVALNARAAVALAPYFDNRPRRFSMSATAAILQEFEQECKTTRRLLERVPTDKLAWKPHAKSMSLGTLAMNTAVSSVVTSECAMTKALNTSNWV